MSAHGPTIIYTASAYLPVCLVHHGCSTASAYFHKNRRKISLARTRICQTSVTSIGKRSLRYGSLFYESQLRQNQNATPQTTRKWISDIIRGKDCSCCVEQTYVHWIKHFTVIIESS